MPQSSIFNRAVQEALEILLSNPSKREQMGTNGAELIEFRHDWSEIGFQVSEMIYKSSIKCS
jgi:glycosyltransferase involved in cell wall biosynthesis